MNCLLGLGYVVLPYFDHAGLNSAVSCHFRSWLYFAALLYLVHVGLILPFLAILVLGYFVLPYFVHVPVLIMPFIAIAGIGYFVLPYLVHAGAKFVHACEWNPHAVKALERNLELNKMKGKCQIHFGDCRKVSIGYNNLKSGFLFSNT